MNRQLLRMDLNLLKALHLLLQERSVSRAADRLCVTPSAMSKTLLRLRETFKDPLLVRVTGGFVLTPEAERLSSLLEDGLAYFASCMESGEFVAERAEALLRIAAPETFAMGAIPTLFPWLNAQAPRLHLESVHLEDDYHDKLAAGALDFVIYRDQDPLPGCIAHRLFTARPMIWCRRDHPLTRLGTIGFDDLGHHPKIAFNSPTVHVAELTRIQTALQAAGLEPAILFKTSHLLVALTMLSQSDAIMMAPDYLFQFPMFKDEVVSLAVDHIPLFSQSEIVVSLIQHERTLHSPLHKWVVAEASRLFEVPLDARRVGYLAAAGSGSATGVAV